jgi:hypothetical protein
VETFKLLRLERGLFFIGRVEMWTLGSSLE